MKELTVRQTAILSAIIFIGSKLLLFPSLLFQLASHDAVFSAILISAAEFVLLFFVVLLLARHPDTTFFDLLSKKLGRIAAVIIISLLILFFLVKLVYNIAESYSFLLNSMFTTFHWLIFIIPTLFLIIYMAAKGLRTIGRTAEIFAVIVLAGLIFAVMLPCFEADLTAVLPVFEHGVTPVINGFTKTLAWSGSPLILLFFMGKIRTEQKLKSKILITNGIIMLLFIAFVFLFLGLFSDTASYFRFAITDLAQYTPYINDIGRLEWLALLMWSVCLFLHSAILLGAVSSAAQEAYKFKTPLLPAIILAAIAAAACLFLSFSFTRIMELSLNEFNYIAGGVIATFLILVLLLILFKRGAYEQTGRN